MKDITIGKYTLESLTTGMYVDPLVIFREYIQNAADAIDEAVNKGLIKKEETYINVEIDKSKSRIIIEDNGTGIEKEKAFKILTDIGNSQKRFSSNKGFRGIGRLSGLSYCAKLIFETSIVGESEKTILEFDSVRLSKLLVPGEYEEYGMEEVIKEITDITYEREEINAHYFRVIMEQVDSRYGLLDDDRVCNYIEQVAPLPYDTNKFRFGNIINQRLEELQIDKHEYNIYFIESKLKKQFFKPYRENNLVDLKKRIPEQITDVVIHEIKNDALDKLVAVVWYGKSELSGTIVEENVKGLRVRKSGILIGDRFLLNEVFKEERFNGWVLGEVIIIDDNVIPNARRDDFEKNDEYLFLMKKLVMIGNEISHEIRLASKTRAKVHNNQVVVEKKIDENNVKVTGTQKSIFKEVDRLISQISTEKQLLIKFDRILQEYNIDRSTRENIVRDLLR